MILLRARIFLPAALALFLLAGLVRPVSAQQPGLPGRLLPGAAPAAPRAAPAAQGEEFYRILFLTFQQLSYTDHPFSQITGADQFKDSDAATGGTATLGVPPSDRDTGFTEKLLHALPSFGVEYGWNTDYPWPKSISVGFDYLHLNESDNDAVSTADIAVAGLSRFEMDVYYLGVPVRLYGFPFRQLGINYFAGLSYGSVSGNLLVRNADPSVRDDVVSFTRSGATAVRLGIDVNGETFGARYELMLVRAGNAKLSRNPFPGQSGVTHIDYSGTVLQIGMFYNF